MAYTCIHHDVITLQGYHWSAVAQHHYYSNCQHDPFVRSGVARAIQDFVKYYHMTPPQKKHEAIIDLCTAIMLAVDTGKHISIPVQRKGGEKLTND